MAEKWFIADLHLNHDFMLEPDPDTKLVYRPEFKNVEHMNETIISNINKVVNSKDKLYLMGDVTFKPATSEKLIRAINGKKRLIIGNHDEIKGKTKYYTKVYDEICYWKKFKEAGFVCTHVPLRTDGIRDAIMNVHGHIHKARLPEPCYFNVSAECVDYRPVHYEQIVERVKELIVKIGKGEWIPPKSISH